ncbi:MAG: hypothetical protein RMK30_02580 [Anaerolineae bacterium]|nr:hypothetical protein [Anaerolineae bacterium]
MELRRYWAVLRRYFWLIALIFLIVLAGSFLTRRPSAPRYGASMRFVVGVIPQSGGNYYEYDRYYTWLASEYMVDDMAEVVRGRTFADKVASRISLPPGSLYGTIASESKHRVLTVHLSWHDPRQLQEIAGTVAELIQKPQEFFPQLGGQEARLIIIDPPVIYPIGPSLREKLDLPIKLVLALGAGIALAFLLDYLDVSVRSREELEALGLKVLGEIPRRRRWPFRR